MSNWNRLRRRYVRLAVFFALCLPFTSPISQAEKIYGKPGAPLAAEALSTRIHNSIHSFYPAGSEEEAQAFQILWWLSD